MAANEQPWAPYRPESGDPWDLRKVAHLHRRAGFGATWEELQRDLKAGPEAAVDRLLNPPQWSAAERQVAEALAQGAVLSKDIDRLKAAWLYRMLYGPDPLGEKLTLFWHGHFAAGYRKVQSAALVLRQNETLRRQARGRFSDLVGEVVVDPAMLMWLDGRDSRKQHPNENLAREFLELFTLGTGRFREADVRQAARAMTGWCRTFKEDANGDRVIEFDESSFDGGAKTFLGETGPWKGADIVRIALGQPACATFLVRKLYRYFISETAEPPEALVEPLAREWQSHDYSIRHVVGCILKSRHFYSQAAYRQRIKSPVEFSVGMLRALEIARAEVNLLSLAAACKDQGQDLFEPPSVRGWEGGRDWLNTTTLLQRTNLAADVLWGNPAFGMIPATLDWANRNRVAPHEAPDKFLDILLDGNLADKSRAVVFVDRQDARTERARAVLQRILSCPEYQLA